MGAGGLDHNTGLRTDGSRGDLIITRGYTLVETRGGGLDYNTGLNTGGSRENLIITRGYTLVGAGRS